MIRFTFLMVAAATVFTEGAGVWSPYLCGFLIGILCWCTFLFSHKPIGASSAYATAVGLAAERIGRAHTDSLQYFRENVPGVNWELLFVIGIIPGAFLAAVSGGEITGGLVPQFWADRFGDSPLLRLSIAFLGGIIMAFGARVADGCTSGHGISGTLQLSVGSWISLACFFIGGVLVAFPLFLL